MGDPSMKEKASCPALNSDSKSIADEQLSELLTSRFRLSQTIVSLETRLDHWLSYLHSLSKIESHCTIPLERSDLDAICYAKRDSFKPSKTHSHTTTSSEKMAAVFNIGAVYSQIAASENHGTIEGLNKKFKAFQSAAGAFRYFVETFKVGESFDVSSECVSMMETLMLANAQECFFERAVIARKSPNSCSQVARQVGLYYEKVQRALSTAPLNQSIDRAHKELFALVKLKASQFYAESCYHYSIRLHEEEEIGEEIARLRMGLVHLLTTKSAVRGASSSLMNVTSRIEAEINARLQKAEKYNKSIYHMRVPDTGSLSDLPTYNSERPKPLESLVALDNCSIISQT